MDATLIADLRAFAAPMRDLGVQELRIYEVKIELGYRYAALMLDAMSKRIRYSPYCGVWRLITGWVDRTFHLWVCRTLEAHNTVRVTVH